MMDLETLREVNNLAAKHPGLTVGELLEMLRDVAEGRPPRHPRWYEQQAERLLNRACKLSELREAIRAYRREVRAARRMRRTVQ